MSVRRQKLFPSFSAIFLLSIIATAVAADYCHRRVRFFNHRKILLLYVVTLSVPLCKQLYPLLKFDPNLMLKAKIEIFLRD